MYVRKDGITKLTKKDNIWLEADVLDDITLDECSEGLLRLLENSERLLNIAEKNKENSQLDIALLFLISALEESSKITYLVTEALASNGNLESRKLATYYFWKKFYSHTRKQDLALSSMLKKGTIENMEFTPIYNKSKNLQKNLEKARQRVFYVDFDKKSKKFISPLYSITNNKFLVEFDRMFESCSDLINTWRKELGETPKSCKKYLIGIRLIHNMSHRQLKKAFRISMDKRKST